MKPNHTPLERLLERLSPDDRLLMNLMYMEGRSIEEIRQKTGWNLSMIKVRAFRARLKLKKHLAKLMKEKSR
jgi:RNA polymerase sigma-70 factor (ECF subfamily)